MARKPSFDPQALVAAAFEGCSPDSCRGLHAGLSLAEAQALVAGTEVRRELEEIHYENEPQPTPIETVFFERSLELGGVAFREQLTLSELRKPTRTHLTATWLFKPEGAIGKVMPKASRELKLRFSELYKKGSSKSDFRFEHAGRANTVFVSHGPDDLAITHGDDE